MLTCWLNAINWHSKTYKNCSQNSLWPIQWSTKYHFFKWPNHGLFFKQTSLQFLQQIYVKNVHPVYSAGIRTQPLVHESPPITTRPGLCYTCPRLPPSLPPWLTSKIVFKKCRIGLKQIITLPKFDRSLKQVRNDLRPVLKVPNLLKPVWTGFKQPEKSFNLLTITSLSFFIDILKM